MKYLNIFAISLLAFLALSTAAFAAEEIYDIRADREALYDQVQQHRKRLDARYNKELDVELKKLGAGATSQQKTSITEKIKAKYMQKHQTLDSAATRLARGREFNRTKMLKEIFDKAGVDFPVFTGTPPGKTGGILTDIDLATIPKKDAEKVMKVLKQTFGVNNVTMANGTISIPNMDTTVFYPMDGGRYAPYTYDNPEYMHYFEKHAPAGNSTTQLNVRKDYVYDNVKKMHNDLTTNAKNLLKDPEKLRNMSKSAFRLDGTTGGGSRLSSTQNSYKDSKKLLAQFQKSLANGKPMKLTTIDKALLISKEKLSAEAVGLYSPGASESEKLAAINKYRKEIKVIVDDSLTMANYWDDALESQLARQYNTAAKAGEVKNAKALKKTMMEMKARKVRAKLGIIRNGGSDMLAESMGLQTGTAKTATGTVKTYYDPKTKKYLSQAQLRKHIIQDDLDALSSMSKMDESFVAQQHAKNPKRQKVVKAVQSSNVAQKTTRVATELADETANTTNTIFQKSAAKMRQIKSTVAEKIAPQLQARAGFGKALGWVGFLAALPQSMKDSQELTEKWITENDTDTTVFAKQFASLSLHASGAKYMFDMFGNNVENRVEEFKKENPGAWEHMSTEERLEVRKQAFKSAIWTTGGQMTKAMAVEMPKAIVTNTWQAAKEGTGLLGDKLDQWSDEKRMAQTQELLKQKKTQIAMRSADALRDWQDLYKAYEKKHGKVTQEYLKNPPAQVGDKQNPDYEGLLDLAYGQEVSDALDQARQGYKDAINAAGGNKSDPRVSQALKRISLITGLMEDYLADPSTTRNSAQARNDLARYKADLEKAKSDLAQSGSKPVAKKTVNTGAKGIHIVSAKYGKTKFCDATAFLRHHCDGKYTCSVMVNNMMCGDPEYGILKEMKYSYRCGDGSGGARAVVDEYKFVEFVCAEPPKVDPKVSSFFGTNTSNGNSSGELKISTRSKAGIEFSKFVEAKNYYQKLPEGHKDKDDAKKEMDAQYHIYMEALKFGGK